MRAKTDEQKKDLCESLYRLWKKQPTLRLGQLIALARNKSKVDLFYVEDGDLMEEIEDFIYE
jgi:hypothetical protein